ncbi:P-loop containing nucleoside triphosphate hydrolase protein [Annulohypoxylon maeteangense]|uniref:P-loop containing nucleoside triphosphate hydrolase protein n=1 Tax=Annulohypoxylon maeteangense TaxID=1927788 RepID=UPI0020080B3F|nr:P-loop containing nucleoside triphosphate hydrolase protein [Annulohypoxylon maeteangense]KAI0886793.1 P-loop containing nucleoside triphosphate hydrolase protein [Annulohypoxylon maeteangense]
MTQYPHSASSNNDVFIAVMGVTGAGKSTFISHCTENQVEIGHDLQACTQGVGVYKSSLFQNRNVYLVDTPGFDDTNRTDKEVLKEIAIWLGKSYEEKIQLSGIIYLHRITDTRMQGSAKKNLLMFKKLCGPQALNRVILATTMWERLPSEDMGVKRENELVNTEEFWGWMTRQGSKVRRHHNTETSAKNLLQIFVSSTNAPIKLKIQEEIVDKHKQLSETSAGIELDSALAQEREKYRRELEEMKEEMKEALAARDNETANIIRQTQQEVLDKIKNLDRDRQELRVSFEKMYQERVAQLEGQLHQQHEANQKMHSSMQEMMVSIERERRKVREPQAKQNEFRTQTNSWTPRYEKPKPKPKTPARSAPYSCLACKKGFWDKELLFEHLEERERAGKSHARDINTGRPETLRRKGQPLPTAVLLGSLFTCLECHKGFTTRDSLFEHLEKQERMGRSHARDTRTGRPERLTRRKGIKNRS